MEENSIEQDALELCKMSLSAEDLSDPRLSITLDSVSFDSSVRESRGSISLASGLFVNMKRVWRRLRTL